MYINCEVKRTTKASDMDNSYVYRSANMSRSLIDPNLFISNSSNGHGIQMKEAYLRGISTTPSTTYAYTSSLPPMFINKIHDVSCCQSFSSFGQLPSLNFISGSLTANGHESIPLNSFIPQIQQRYDGNDARPEDSLYRKKILPKIIPSRYVSS